MMSFIVLAGAILLAVSLVFFTIALGGISYQHLVELPQWKAADVQHADFGRFFKLFMPTSFASLLLSISLLWNKSGSVRLWLLAGAIGMILTAWFTNRYFVSIHTQLFNKQTLRSEREILSNRWHDLNLYRIGIMFITVICLLIGYTLLLIG